MLIVMNVVMHFLMGCSLSLPLPPPPLFPFPLSLSLGIKHDDYTCDGCRVMPIYGIRWECAECPSISLCSMCYHGDKHSLRHTFNRLTTPVSRKLVREREREGGREGGRGREWLLKYTQARKNTWWHSLTVGISCCSSKCGSTQWSLCACDDCPLQ